MGGGYISNIFGQFYWFIASSWLLRLPIFKSSHWGTERSWRRYHLHQVQMLWLCWESHLNLKSIRDEWMNIWMYEYIYIYIYILYLFIYCKHNDDIIYVSDNHQFSSSSSFDSCFFCGYVKDTNNKTTRRRFFPYEGELGAERLMELLAASFDWDASLRDPSAALAYLGRKPEEKLDYEELVGGFGGLVGGWDGSLLELVRWGGGNGESSWWGLVENFYKGFPKSQYW